MNQCSTSGLLSSSENCDRYFNSSVHSLQHSEVQIILARIVDRSDVLTFSIRLCLGHERRRSVPSW